jgi:hypothetical protein
MAISVKTQKKRRLRSYADTNEIVLNYFQFCHNARINRLDPIGLEDTPEVLFSLNAASSLNAAFSGSSTFIVDGLAQLSGFVAPAINVLLTPVTALSVYVGTHPDSITYFEDFISGIIPGPPNSSLAGLAGEAASNASVIADKVVDALADPDTNGN